MSRRILALVLAVGAQSVPLSAQPARSAATAPDTVDRLVVAEMARTHIPGVSIYLSTAARPAAPLPAQP